MMKSNKKKGIIITIITIIVAIIIALGVGVYLIKREDDKKISLIKQELESSVTLEDKELEVGTEINIKDLNIPKEAKVTINDKKVTDTYKFESLGDYKLEVKLEKEYTNKLNKKTTIEATKDANYKIIDTTKPEITGVEDKKIYVGDEIPDYKSNVKANDNVDGEVEVKIDGNVDNTKAGEYKITYTATDKSQNVETKEATITVEEKPAIQTQTTTSSTSKSTTTKSKGNSSSKSNSTTSSKKSTSSSKSSSSSSKKKATGNLNISEDQATEGGEIRTYGPNNTIAHGKESSYWYGGTLTHEQEEELGIYDY